MENHVVIMAGGIGSRFWPMSTLKYPKQFIDVLGCGRTLIQMTVDRFLPLCPASRIWVVTSESYREIVHEQLPAIPQENILAEPLARNTAPCIAYACWKIKSRHPDANVVVTPSDALIIDTQEFRRVIGKALDFSSQGASIVTVGIRPSRPETGYGYIDVLDSDTEIHKVRAFKEKPSLEVAQHYLSAGHYLWNAGIFVWKIDTIVSAMRQYVPHIASIMDELSESFHTGREAEELARLFPLCESISIDYAVMEKSEAIYTLPADFGWSDLGSWNSLRLNSQRDNDENAVVGEGVTLVDCEGCVVRVNSLKKVVLEGLKNYIVAEKDGSLLVCRLSDEQKIKEFSK